MYQQVLFSSIAIICFYVQRYKKRQQQIQKIPQHQHELPIQYISQIPEYEKIILFFLLYFIQYYNYPIDGLLITGGYVRDLLLNKVPDDLDVSLCLLDCNRNITVEYILNQLQEFLPIFQTLNNNYNYITIQEIKIVTVLSHESKEKKIDTSKAIFYLQEMKSSNKNSCCRRIEVDFMPTIGEEIYNNKNRIPTRNHRGTPLDDALRRDLTIGALFIKVTLKKQNKNNQMQYILYDYYHGINDLYTKTLRSPYPLKYDINVLYNQVITNSITNYKIYQTMNLNLNLKNYSKSCQILWWIKILQDDPLRIVRCIRFASILDFEIHSDFWLVIPYTLIAINKVAGNRKLTEFYKLLKQTNNNNAIIKFLIYAFNYQFYNPEDDNDDMLMRKTTCLANSLFGGQDSKNHIFSIDKVISFNLKKFLFLIKLIPSKNIDNDIRASLSLLIAIYSSTFIQNNNFIYQFQQACNGLCTSNIFRKVGIDILSCNIYLKYIYIDNHQFGNLDQIFGEYCGLNGKEFSEYVYLYYILKIINFQDEIRIQLLIEFYKLENTIDNINKLIYSINILKKNTITINGNCMNEYKHIIPNYMRNHFIIRLHIFTRILNLFTNDLITTKHFDLFIKQKYKSTSNLTLIQSIQQELYDDVEKENNSLKTPYLKSNIQKSPLQSSYIKVCN